MLIIEHYGGQRYKLNQNNEKLLPLLKYFEQEKEKFQIIEPIFISQLSDFVNDCLKTFSGIQKIVLFGSKAKGKAHEYSDTDIAIFFYNKPKAAELSMEKIIEKYKSLKIQYHLFKIDEAKSPLMQNIKNEGIILTEI